MQGVGMARNRKNRLIVSREPNGRPSRSEDEREFSPTQVRRLRDAAMRGLRDEEWGTELGRYYLENSITSEMYAAGKWWAEKAARYANSIDVPGNIKAVSFQRGSLGTPPDPDSDKGREVVTRDQIAAMEFNEAHSVLCQAGAIAERVVRNLCERDESPTGHLEFYCLRLGLNMIAKYRDLTKSGKSRNVR